MNDNDDWGDPPPVKTNLKGDLQRAFNYGWKSAIAHMKDTQSNKHPEKRTWNGQEIAEIGEVKTVLLSTQNLETDE